MKKKFKIILLIFIYFKIFSYENIGQRFILTLPENKDYFELEHWLEETKPAGIMLTSGHFTNRTETKILINFLQKKAKVLNIFPLIIAVDWEGGMVSRPNESGNFYSAPSPYNLAQAGRTYVHLAAQLIGQQCKSIGINMNFAPSLDFFDTNNYILATRTFSDNPEIITKMGQTFINGLLSQNIVPVIKHFPGLGSGKNDTHLAETVLDSDQELLKQNMRPFINTIKSEVPACMVTHAICPFFGDKQATLNPKVVKFLEKLNPDLLLITDDFCMKAIDQKKLEKNIMESLNSGFDLIIFSGNYNQQIDLIKSLEEKNNFLENNNLEKIKKFKEKYLINNQDNKFKLNLDKQKTSELLTQKAIKYPLNFKFLKNFFLISIDLPKIRPTENWFIKDNLSYLAQKLKGKINIQEIIFNPKDKKALEKIKKIDLKNKKVILQTFFYGQGIWNETQKEILNYLKKYLPNLIIISLGHPFEQTILPKATIFNLGSFNRPLLDELFSRLFLKSSYSGAEIFVKNLGKYLTNKNFGLLCHNASYVLINKNYEFLPDILYNWTKNPSTHSLSPTTSANTQGKQVMHAKLIALFAPEHGLTGQTERGLKVNTDTTSKWDCPVYSLHGKNKKPTPEMLKDLDLLIIDLHDIGTRCFTYLSTLDLTLKACAENNVPVLILENPNPLSFWGTRGPGVKDEFKSFVSQVDIPFLYGKTLNNALIPSTGVTTSVYRGITIIKSSNPENFYLTHQFLAPSPNLQTLESIYAYPITVFLEGTNYSEGRGTEYPFEQFGAPWVDKENLAQELNSLNLTGVYFEPVNFTPKSIPIKALKPLYQDKLCQGVFIHFYDIKKADPIKIAFSILKTLFKFYPENSEFIKSGKNYFIDNLIGDSAWREKINQELLMLKKS